MPGAFVGQTDGDDAGWPLLEIARILDNYGFDIESGMLTTGVASKVSSITSMRMFRQLPMEHYRLPDTEREHEHRTAVERNFWDLS